MWFWFFMLIMTMLLPMTMLGFGKMFSDHAPKEINALFGYRTNMSMKNRETWEYAHWYCGKIWYGCGAVLLPLSIVCMLFSIGKSEDVIGTLGGALCIVQFIPFIGSIFFTERALKKNFDKDGNRR